MTKLFQFMTAALLGLALIVPAAAQDGKRPKEKRVVDPISERKGGDRPGNGNNSDRSNQDRGGRNGNGENGKAKDKDKRRNRPNDDQQYDL